MPPAPEFFAPRRAPNGFFKYVETRLGRRWKDSIQDFEDIHKHLAVSRSHVKFLRRCHEFGLVPKGLRVKFRPMSVKEQKLKDLME